MASPADDPKRPQKAFIRSTCQSLTSALSSNSSSFKSLVSAKSVKHKTLPKFLRDDRAGSRLSSVLPFGPIPSGDPSEILDSLHAAEEMNLLSAHFTPVKLRAPKSPDRSIRPVKTRSENQVISVEEVKKKMQERTGELTASLRSEEGDGKEVVFSIRGEEFFREDLRHLVTDLKAPRKVMQAYFKYLNRRNRRLQNAESVKIFRIAFTEEIFGKRKSASLHSKSDPMKFE